MVDPFKAIGNFFSKSLPKWIFTPRNAVLSIVLGYVVNEFVYPIVSAILFAVNSVIFALRAPLLGGDGKISATGAIGLADLPLVIIDLFITLLAPLVYALANGIATFNATVAGIAASAGIAGPAVAATLVLVEIALAVFAVTWLFRLVLGYVGLADLNPRTLLGVIR